MQALWYRPVVRARARPNVMNESMNESVDLRVNSEKRLHARSLSYVTTYTASTCDHCLLHP